MCSTCRELKRVGIPKDQWPKHAYKIPSTPWKRSYPSFWIAEEARVPRMRKIKELLNLTLYDVADIICVTVPTCTRMFAGLRNPSVAHVRLMEIELGRHRRRLSQNARKAAKRKDRKAQAASAPPDMVQAILDLAESGLGHTEITERVATDPYTVQYILRRYGMDKAKPKQDKKKTSKADKVS